MRSTLISLATAGLFLISLNGASAQREVEPPAIPPMLEGQRPLAQPETKEAAPPKQEEAKSKAKVRTAKPPAKGTKQAKGKQQQKKPAKVASKKVQKNHKKKPAVTKQPGPGEG